MTRNITLASILITVFILLSLSSAAQEKGYDGEITITPVNLEQHGDLLYVELDVRMVGVRVKPALTIDFSPWLSAPAGRASLPVVSVRGRESYKEYVRSLAFEGKTPEKVAEEGPNLVLKGYGAHNETLRYRHVMRYEPWMADAMLEVMCHNQACGQRSLADVLRLPGKVKLEEIPAPKEMVPQLAFVRPEAEEIKSREIQAECRLDFVVNKTNIDPAYMNNPRELARIRTIIDDLKNDPAITIHSLEIIGYASPEGSLANNKRLSEGRAIALRDYLASQYDFPLRAYKVTFGGENWDGLVKALTEYPMVYKEEVLGVIGTTAPDQNRKSRLMSLRGGVPYRDMLKNIYPSLRTAVCVIDYEIKGFQLEEAVVVFRTRPQNLSLNELYLVANTMEQGSRAFIDVFETAVRLYPEDDVANLNAAVAALQNKNVDSAERYLQRIVEKKGIPEYNNAMGALAVLKKDYTTAENFFRMAADAGSEVGRQNLEELQKIK